MTFFVGHFEVLSKREKPKAGSSMGKRGNKYLACTPPIVLLPTSLKVTYNATIINTIDTKKITLIMILNFHFVVNLSYLFLSIIDNINNKIIKIPKSRATVNFPIDVNSAKDEDRLIMLDKDK